MSVEANKDVVRRYFEEGRSQGNLAVVEEIFAADAIRHTANGPLQDVPARQRDVIIRWRTAFPDYHDEVLALVGDGDQVVAHILFTGTHTGIFEYESLGPWEPTGRAIKCREFFLYRLAHGKIVEVWSLWDRRDFMQQLGITESITSPVSAVD